MLGGARLASLGAEAEEALSLACEGGRDGLLMLPSPPPSHARGTRILVRGPGYIQRERHVLANVVELGR